MADEERGAIRTGRDGAVATVVIDRPERANALHPALADELRLALEAAWGDPATSVVVLRGAGERAFCGGFDLAGVARGIRDDELVALCRALRSAPVPTVAAVNGHAVGAGFGLACDCDLRVVRAGAKVGVPAVKLGLAYDGDGLRRALAVAPGVRRLLFTGEVAPVAEVAGFADVVAGPEGFDDEVAALALAVAAASPAALAYLAAVVRATLDGPGAGVDEAGWRRRVLDGPDVAEALAARAEGRPPVFEPRPGA